MWMPPSNTHGWKGGTASWVLFRYSIPTGLLGTLIAPITLGAQVVYIARFSPVATLNAIREHQISLVIAVPSMYGALVRLKDAKPDDFRNVYALISGGEPLPAAVRLACEEKLGVTIYEGYGLTETIGPIAFNVPGSQSPGFGWQTHPKRRGENHRR